MCLCKLSTSSKRTLSSPISYHACIFNIRLSMTPNPKIFIFLKNLSISYLNFVPWLSNLIPNFENLIYKFSSTFLIHKIRIKLMDISTKKDSTSIRFFFDFVYEKWIGMGEIQLYIFKHLYKPYYTSYLLGSFLTFKSRSRNWNN